jgi:tetratricopeptide (TPR) repeat protein
MRQRQTPRTAAAATALGLILAGAAAAQNIARVNFVVTLPSGEPVQGVELVVTIADRPDFVEKLKTSKRGEAIFAANLTEANYKVSINYEGYALQEMEFWPSAGETVTRRIVLSPKEAPPPGEAGAPAAGGMSAGVPDEPGLRPAEKKFNEGVKAALDEDFTTAKSRFLEAVELDSRLAPAHQALAGLFLDDKDYEAAGRHASQAVEIDPKNTRAYRILYEVHTRLGNEEEAAKAFAKLDEIGQGSEAADVVYNDGVAALREGDAETAKAHFERALELRGDLMPAVSALAIVYLREKSYARAVEMSERFLAVTPDDAQVLRVRWQAYRGLGDEAKAKEAYDAFASGSPEALAAELFNAGAALFDSGDAAGAREKFETVLAVVPDHPRAHYQLGMCLVQQGDNAGARQHFERFIELAPDDPEVATAREMLSYLKQ